ncbi:MAG: DUF2804 domain-containing protein [Oscillospiraceae bacterium]|jgi:hypothetical protein
MQHEITKGTPLLDESGNLTQAGYAKSPLLTYRRADIKANKLRIKEWDYYLIHNDRFALALTIADNSYMGMASISLIDFEECWEITKSPIQFMTMGKIGMPESSEYGDTQLSGRGYGLFFKNNGTSRTLIAHMDNFGPKGPISAKVTLTDAPRESMVIAIPFMQRGHFYYNQKINCMRAEGQVNYGGAVYEFQPKDSFAVLDWGRGVWPYHNTWYWGSGSGLVKGVPFGFNIGYGFGDTSAATENMLFYEGKAHKLSQVKFNIPVSSDGREQFLKPWTFTSDDGRFEMDFIPIIDRAAYMSVGPLMSDQHQVFGRFTGKAVLDDGRTIKIKDFLGFAEKVENKW